MYIKIVIFFDLLLLLIKENITQKIFYCKLTTGFKRIKSRRLFILDRKIPQGFFSSFPPSAGVATLGRNSQNFSQIFLKIFNRNYTP